METILERRPLEIPSDQKVDWTEDMPQKKCWVCGFIIEPGQTAFKGNSHNEEIHLDCIISLGE